MVAARIEDGCLYDDWQVTDSRTGDSVPLRADRWYQADPDSDPKITTGDFSGIRINIWNRAKVRRFLTHQLAGGGNHNRGYHAFRWDSILHGNAGEFGKYDVLSVLPDKIARFLYQYHDTSCISMGLPPIPLDRSNISVHSILQPQQVQDIWFHIIFKYNAYSVYYAYFAYTSHICASEQGSAGHSAHSSVQQQHGTHLHFLHPPHWSYKTSWSYASIVIAVCPKANA